MNIKGPLSELEPFYTKYTDVKVRWGSTVTNRSNTYSILRLSASFLQMSVAEYACNYTQGCFDI